MPKVPTHKVGPTPVFHVLAAHQGGVVARPVVTTGSSVLHVFTPGYDPMYLGLHLGENARLTIQVGKGRIRNRLIMSQADRVIELAMLCNSTQVSISRTFIEDEDDCGICLALQQDGTSFGVIITPREMVKPAAAFTILNSYLQTGGTNLTNTHLGQLGTAYKSLTEKVHEAMAFPSPSVGVDSHDAIATVPARILGIHHPVPGPEKAGVKVGVKPGVRVVHGKWGEEIERDILRAVVPDGTSWRMPDPQNAIDEHYFIEDK